MSGREQLSLLPANLPRCTGPGIRRGRCGAASTFHASDDVADDTS